ncbi:MAG: ImmA/IrrE family metallo-endopeptidase [bacterium]
MEKIKVIKTEQDYQEALKLAEKLVGLDPDPDSAEGEQLTLLTALIQDYEAKLFPETLPDPIEAIKFRMEQADLKPADLIPYIGSRSRVSEILSGKRQLSLDMVRALSTGLGIPAKALIQKPSRPELQNWDMGLVRTMERRGYFGKKTLKKYDKSELISNLFEAFDNLQLAVLYRKTSFRSAPRTDNSALLAWGLQVLKKAEKIKNPFKYKKATVTLKFMQDVVRLSAKNNGPLLACDYLKKHGIKFVVAPHLPKTHLDGATFFVDKDNPVIGLTIRHDRPDNFWFTLMHELAHVALHYENGIEYFYDEKIQEKDGTQIDDREKAADELAEESILPMSKWEISAAKRTPNQFSTEDLANELGVQVAVIAGMIRFKHQKFYYLNELIHDESLKIKKYFSNEFKD